MYINLDVVMRLVLIGLVVAGIGALITLAMLFKNLIQTMHSLTGALDLLQRDLAKLEGPLDTVDALSTTVNEIQTSAKRAANTAIDTFSTSSQRIMNWVDAKTSIKDDSHGPKPEAEPKQNEPQKNNEDEDHSDQGPKGDFKPIEPDKNQNKPQKDDSDLKEARAASKPDPASSKDPVQEKAKEVFEKVKEPEKPAVSLPDQKAPSASKSEGQQEKIVEEIMIGIPKETIHPNEALVVNTVEDLGQEEGLSANEIEEDKK